MSFILTIIASDIILSPAQIDIIEGFIEEEAIGLNGTPSWLEPHTAVDLPIQNCLTLAQMKKARTLLAPFHMDVLCTPELGRRKKLFLADMDSTIVTTETLDELAAKAGIKDQIAAITARAMNGELDFHAALKERVALLKGLPVVALQETLDETIPCPGAEALIKTLRAKNVPCVLVSGGFTYFTGAIAESLGFTAHHGNTLNYNEEILEGTVALPILDKDSKLAFLQSYARQYGLDLSQTIAIGDGANDLPMLTAAGLGIGYRPKPVLEDTLLNVLKFTDLTSVLYAQGYHGPFADC